MKKLFVFVLALFLTFAVYGRGGGHSFSSGGGHSFSSSHSFSSGSSSKSFSSSSGKSYGSGKSTPASTSSSKSSFGSAEKAQARVDSKTRYTKFNASKQSYDYLKTQPKEVYATRATRQQTVFKTYYVNRTPAPVFVYHDTSWNPYFWMWLMDHHDRQADWVYNHRDQISDERYRDLVAKNKDLAAQVKALEDKKVAKNPNYAPDGVDKDLMYSDDYVKQVQQDNEPKVDAVAADDGFSWLSCILATLGVLGFGWIIYAIFIKERSY